MSGWTEPGADAPVSATEGVAWALLLAAVTWSRWAVAPQVLYDWDAGNYALSIADLDVYEHQPHAPGSPLFVLMLKAAALLGGTEATPFLLVNAVLGAVVLTGLGFLVRRTVGPAAAWGVAATLAVAPQLWHHGAATTAYVAEAACSVTAAATALALARGQLRPAIGGVLLGVVVGVRPNTALTLLPVAVVGLALARPGLSGAARAAGAFALTSLAWFAPLVAFGGGWARYREASAALGNWQVAAGSALGSGPDAIATNGRRLALYLLDGGNALWPLLALDLVVGGLAVVAARRRVAMAPAARTVLLLGAWAAPATVLYAVHHLPKSGYVLTLLPAVFVAVALAGAGAVRTIARPGLRRALGGIQVLGFSSFVVLNATAFLFTVPAEWLDDRDTAIPLPPVLVGTSDYGAAALQYRTWPHQALDPVLERLDPERDLALFLYGSHELYRVAMVHHGDRWMMATSLDHERWTSTRGPSFGTFQTALLNHPVRSRDWELRTRVSLRDSAIQLDRAGRTMTIGVESVPRAVLVVLPCPPCELEVGAGFGEARMVAIGGGYRAARLPTSGFFD